MVTAYLLHFALLHEQPVCVEICLSVAYLLPPASKVRVNIFEIHGVQQRTF